MADIQPFPGVRPRREKAIGTSALSYEEMLAKFRAGELFQNHFSEYYVYEMRETDRTQRAIIAGFSIDDYLNGIIENHCEAVDEASRDKINMLENDRLQTEMIIIAYHKQPYIELLLDQQKADYCPAYQFTTPDGVEHVIWEMYDFAREKKLMDAFVGTTDFYILTGHDMAAAAVENGLNQRRMHRDYDGTEPFNYFMCALIPYEDVREGTKFIEPKFQANIFSHAL